MPSFVAVSPKRRRWFARMRYSPTDMLPNCSYLGQELDIGPEPMHWLVLHAACRRTDGISVASLLTTYSDRDESAPADAATDAVATTSQRPLTGSRENIPIVATQSKKSTRAAASIHERIGRPRPTATKGPRPRARSLPPSARARTFAPGCVERSPIHGRTTAEGAMSATTPSPTRAAAIERATLRADKGSARDADEDMRRMYPEKWSTLAPHALLIAGDDSLREFAGL
jgi:hypothetical protein